MATATAPRNYVSSLAHVKSKFYEWPALSICLSVTALSFVFVFAVAAAGWPGPVTSNCYEDFLVTADCYCERLRGDQPGDAWMAQPMNTISNLAFIAGGLLIAYGVDSRKFPSEEWWKDESKNPMTQDMLYSTTYALMSCLLGIGSICLHASFTTWGRQLDMTAMYFLANFMWVYHLVKKRHLSKEQGIWVYIFVNAALVYWVLVYSTPQQTRNVFTALLVSSWMLDIFYVDHNLAEPNTEARKWLFGTIAQFLVVYAIWKASESAGPMCYPDSIWQGHSLWHIGSGTAIVGQYLCYLAEHAPTKTPHVKQLSEATPFATPINDMSYESDSESS